MSSKYKKLVRELSQKTGVSYAGAVNLLRKGATPQSITPVDHMVFCGPLYPVQRFLVKLVYNLELDSKIPEDTSARITIPNGPIAPKHIRTFSEKDYLAYLFNEGRCNIGVQDHDRREAALVLGRRSGKTRLTGLIASYEVRKVLEIGDHQAYFDRPERSRIQVLTVSTDKDTAEVLMSSSAALVSSNPYFKPYLSSNTHTYLNFRSPHDLEIQDGKATVRLKFSSTRSKGIRGNPNVAVVMDEPAYSHDGGKESYAAATPSAYSFRHKPGFGRIVLLSSPRDRSGKLFEIHEKAMQGSQEHLTVRIPTWEVNPTISASFYETLKVAGQRSFKQYQAEFDDAPAGLPAEVIQQAIDLHKEYPVGLLRLANSYVTGDSETKQQWAQQILAGIVEKLSDSEAEILIKVASGLLSQSAAGSEER